MAEEITRTIENVDRLFSEIVVNGESHVSQRFNPPSPQSSTPSAQAQAQGEDVHAVELNNVLHNFSDPDVVLDVQALQQGLAGEISARTTADQALDLAMAQEINARSSADNTLQGNINTVSGNVTALSGRVTAIEGKIPAQASAQNQLADKNFVNSSIATNTANFLGTYTSMADIEAIQNPTNNDYVFLQTTDASGNNLFDRYKYNAEQGEWLFEYELNNSSFTAEQWATINSGLTQNSVTQEIENAINALDVAQAGGTGKYIESIKQVDGKITAVEKTFAVALLDIAHPVGSLYWTSSSEDPAVTFGGGTWVQIKDVFVWAKGDSDTVNATGGSKTVTLTANQIPSHTHSVTASGSISGGAYKFTGTQATLKATQGGSISGGAYKFTGSEVTSLGSSSANTGSESSHTHGAGTISALSAGAWRIPQRGITGSGIVDGVLLYEENFPETYRGTGICKAGSSTTPWFSGQTKSKRATYASSEGYMGYIGEEAHTHVMSGNTSAGSSHSHTMAHTHKVTANGTISVTTNPTFTGSEHSHTYTPAGTISVTTNPTFTGSAVTSGGAGGGSSHSNMPPYVIKYCWERTA